LEASNWHNKEKQKRRRLAAERRATEGVTVEFTPRQPVNAASEVSEAVGVTAPATAASVAAVGVTGIVIVGRALPKQRQQFQHHLRRLQKR